MTWPALRVVPQTGAQTRGYNRLGRMVNDHLPAVWRFVRRLGIPECDVDDAVQEVIWITARKLDRIAEESERAFMLATAYRVASDMRHSRARRGEVDEVLANAVADPQPGADALIEQKRMRDLLDRVLAGMPLTLRAAFILYEIDGLSMVEIASTLGLPQGTVASRLRRARELFESRVARLEERMQTAGGQP